jgi:glycosyltransferase involved in cell wall biosynthesis
MLAAFRLVRAGRREAADCYIAPEPESWCAALLIKWFYGGRVVFDMHEHFPTELAKFFPDRMQLFATTATRAAMRFLSRYTDHIILTRESFESMWEGLPAPRSIVINANHLQDRCTDIPETIRDTVGAGPVVIHQGTFGEIRGAWQLLDAMKLVVRQVPGVRCVLLGDYVTGSLRKFRRAIRKAGLETTFVFPATVPYEEVPAYIAAADVGLILFQPGLVNHTFAMPHKLFDYMREGKPVIAPDFAIEVANILDGAEAGVLVEVTDPKAIALAIVELLTHPELAARLGENGRRAVEERYNWELEEVKLLAAIDSLRDT